MRAVPSLARRLRMDENKIYSDSDTDYGGQWSSGTTTSASSRLA